MCEMYYVKTGTSKAIYGLVAGIVMFIGFLPNAFNATSSVHLLDTYQGALGDRYRLMYIAEEI